jgi:iron complex outermembrane receptor protein
MALAGLAQTPSFAQQQAPASAVLDRVEVTGSHVKRLNISDEGATAVQILSREEIAASGTATLRELLDTVAATTGELSDIGGGGSFANGATGVSLHNLGKQSTLVLLNSRRLSTYPLADWNSVFTNIDSLPLEAIERVEILKSGGSALYGSDAVAGVINIVTRSTFQGLQAKASYEGSLLSHQFKNSSASLTGGIGNLNTDGYNVLANVDFYHRDSFFWSDVLKYSNPAYKAYSPSFGSPSSYSYPGNIIGVGPVPGCTYFNASKTLCEYDRYSAFQVQPSADRVSGMVSGKLNLSNGMQAFAEAIFSDTTTDYHGAHSYYGSSLGTTVWADPATNAIRSFTYRGLPAQNPLNPTGSEVQFRYRFIDDGNGNNVDTGQYRALAGLKGQWNDMDWETAAGVMGGTTHQRTRGSFSDSGFKQEIGDYTQPTLDPNFFNMPSGYKIGQPNSADVLNTLFPTYGYHATTTQTFLDGKLSGEVGKLPAGAINIATGFELRHESVSILPTDNLASGDIVGYGSVRTDASRTFGAIYTEAELPITKTLDAQVAGRVDKFPGFAAHFSPKLALRFQPIKEVLLRGSAEGGFRAPNLNESAPSTKSAFANGLSDPQRCNAATQLRNDLLAQAAGLADSDPNKALLQARADSVVGAECNFGVASLVVSNPNLKPETSRIYTLGLVLQPVKDFSTTVDYYQVHRRNEIQSMAVQDLLNAESQQPAGVLNRAADFSNDPTFITPAEVAKYQPGAPRLLYVSDHFRNLGQTKVSGVDWAAKGTVDTSIGRVGMDLDSSYLIEFRQYSPTGGRWGDNLAGRYGFPHWYVKLGGSLETGKWRQNLTYIWSQAQTLTGDYYDPSWTVDDCVNNKGLTAGQCRVGGYQRWDYNVRYAPTKSLTFGVNLRNLLNRRPPMDYRAFGQGGIIPPNREDVMGRMLRLTAEYKFI